MLRRNKSSKMDPKDILELYKKLTIVSVDIADDYLQDKVSSLLHDKELLNKLLQEKDLNIEKALLEKDLRIKEKDLLIKEKDLRIEEKDLRIKEKDREIMAALGLLTSRGIIEALLRKLLIEMKVLRLVKDTEKEIMTNIITLLKQKEKHFPPTSKCYKFLQAAKSCECDLQSLYSSLSHSIHGAPWHGPSVKIFSKALKEEEICLLKFIADDMIIPYDLQA